jgi:hypothetical protein
MPGNLYVSPETSSAGSENIPVNLKPEINLRLVEQNGRRGRRVVFNGNSRTPISSKGWGNAPFFTNAKPARMLERGWVRAIDKLTPGEKGLYTEKDGPESEVEVVEVINNKKLHSYTLKNKAGNLFNANNSDRFEEWDFYYPTAPKPFIPRRGGTRRKSKSRKTRRKA